MKTNHVSLLLLVALVVLAGCTGGGADGGTSGESDETTTADAGVGGSSSDWCNPGQTAQISNPETGEEASWEIVGIVKEDGREVCKAVWETNQGEISRVEKFFTEDESYRKMISYDADGAVVNEVNLRGDVAGADGDESADAWCDDSATMEFANPQTGEQASWVVEGIVEEDGREVCKAVWETNQGEVGRIEMYFTEDESYRKMVTYDADGELIDEFEFGGG